MRIETVTVTPFQQNARIVFDEKTLRGSVIDPGGDVKLIMQRIQQLGLTIESVIATHAHIDHVGGVKRLLRVLQDVGGASGPLVPFYAHSAEREMRASIQMQAAFYGLSPEDFENCPEPDGLLEDGEFIEFAGESVEVLFTPGHSPAHVSLYVAGAKDAPVLFAGDAIFAGSIGRTDIPGGNHRQLMESIESKIFVLPDETVIMPGHGPNTTVGKEKRTKPFFN